MMMTTVSQIHTLTYVVNIDWSLIIDVTAGIESLSGALDNMVLDGSQDGNQSQIGEYQRTPSPVEGEDTQMTGLPPAAFGPGYYGNFGPSQPEPTYPIDPDEDLDLDLEGTLPEESSISGQNTSMGYSGVTGTGGDMSSFLNSFERHLSDI